MYHYHCLNQIADAGIESFSADYIKTDSMKDADMLLVRSADLHGTELPEGIVGVARAGAGVNNIPHEELAKQGVVVFNTPGANANGVKELVFAGMLLAARDIIGGANWVREQVGDEQVATHAEKEKKKFAGTELSGKKLGVIGLGAIGVLVANAAVHFGMEVYGYDPYISVDAAWNLSRNIRHISDVNQIYQECDYITIHVPLLDSTRGMIGEDALSMMKKNVVILNFARDLLADEDAVLRALDDGRIARYVSDFPNPKTVGHPGVILTPHIGASTEESEICCAKMAVKQLRDYVENGNIVNSVNYPACNMGVCHAACRIAINHANTPKMISQFTEILADVNIANMNNSSRGSVAYSLFDLEQKLDEDKLAQLRSIEGVYRVRVIGA